MRAAPAVDSARPPPRTKGPFVARKRPTISHARQDRPSRAQQLIEFGALSMSSERNGGVHTLRLSGELDLATTHRVEAELKRVEASGAQTIVIDLSELAFINSTGVHLLVDAEARSRAQSTDLALLRGSPAVQRVLEICGVDAALPFDD